MEFSWRIWLSLNSVSNKLYSRQPQENTLVMLPATPISTLHSMILEMNSAENNRCFTVLQILSTICFLLQRWNRQYREFFLQLYHLITLLSFLWRLRPAWKWQCDRILITLLPNVFPILCNIVWNVRVFIKLRSTLLNSLSNMDIYCS